ncbi:MAG TPA: MGMT family protein [Woeseiaceae bacterium]|nr:MGMT family protein [Woeseiaceae bacterium]
MTEKLPTQKRNERIWQTIGDIPQGKVASYGQVAAIAGIPRGARQTAYALRVLPRGHALPWYRVITSSGRIAFKPGSRPFREQVKRLKMEGITVKGGRVDMRIFRWQPDLDELLWKPSATWDG